MKFGLLGLGKMGSRIARKLVLQQHELVVWNRSHSPVDELRSSVQATDALSVAKSLQELVSELPSPKVIWMMLPAHVTQTILDQLLLLVQPGDIIIDGGNAYYKDTTRRYEELKEKQIKYLGIGVSGGIIAEKNGYPLMAGGDKSAYTHITPLLDCLAKPHGGHAYFGQGGAGHFVKMVHNGIEYGMMQAIGEGFGVLEKSSFQFNLSDIARVWQNGTIISGFLIDRAKDALDKNAHLSDIVGKIDATGEAEWTVKEAKEENVPSVVIEKSLQFRLQSQKDTAIQESFAAKMVAALRREFGGHAVEKKN